MITWNQIADLLKLSAVYDQRTVAEEDIRGWLLVAQRSRWTLRAAQRVIVDHYAQGGERPRITPALITDAIRKARSQAAATFEPPVLPDHLPNADYPEWYRGQLAAHVDRLVEDWADGKPIPVSAPRRPAEIDPRVRAAIEGVAARLPGGPS